MQPKRSVKALIHSVLLRSDEMRLKIDALFPPSHSDGGGALAARTSEVSAFQQLLYICHFCGTSLQSLESLVSAELIIAS